MSGHAFSRFKGHLSHQMLIGLTNCYSPDDALVRLLLLASFSGWEANSFATSQESTEICFAALHRSSSSVAALMDLALCRRGF